MRSGIKIGSGGSFSAIQNELIVSDADTGNGVNLTAFSNQTSQGEGGGAQPGYPNDHHSDEHSNPIADSLSSSEAESHNQTFTGKRISLAPSAYVFICSSFARQNPPVRIYLSVGLSVCAFGMVSESGNHHSDQRGMVCASKVSD